MGDLEKPEDSGFESTLSSYLKGGSRSKQGGFIPVSYTHLTLPTIYSV